MTPQQIKARIAMMKLSMMETGTDYTEEIDLLTNQLAQCSK